MSSDSPNSDFGSEKDVGLGNIVTVTYDSGVLYVTLRNEQKGYWRTLDINLGCYMDFRTSC